MRLHELQRKNSISVFFMSSNFMHHVPLLAPTYVPLAMHSSYLLNFFVLAYSRLSTLKNTGCFTFLKYFLIFGKTKIISSITFFQEP